MQTTEKPKTEKPKPEKPESALELRFLRLLQEAGLPAPVSQYRALAERRYRWDFAYPYYRILIEIQGGTWSRRRSAHNSGCGLRRDYEKNNLAVLAGWRILYFSADMLQDGTAVQTVYRLLAFFGGET